MRFVDHSSLEHRSMALPPFLDEASRRSHEFYRFIANERVSQLAWQFHSQIDPRPITGRSQADHRNSQEEIIRLSD